MNTYPCCEHCRNFGRRLGGFGEMETDHSNHHARCYTSGCPGSVAEVLTQIIDQDNNDD